jgi:cytochrome c peroxidase
MVRNIIPGLLLLGLAVPPALAQDDLVARAREQFQAIPMSAPELPGNPATPAKVELGKMLYFEPRLSASHAISCNSCHNIGLGGADAEPTSIGHRWQHGGRNAPTVLNAVFNTAQFWDGRARDLEQQAGGPMVNPVEMAWHCHVERAWTRSLMRVNGVWLSRLVSGACLLSPDPKGLGARAPVIASCHQVATRAEVTIDSTVG